MVSIHYLTVYRSSFHFKSTISLKTHNLASCNFQCVLCQSKILNYLPYFSRLPLHTQRLKICPQYTQEDRDAKIVNWRVSFSDNDIYWQIYKSHAGLYPLVKRHSGSTTILRFDALFIKTPEQPGNFLYCEGWVKFRYTYSHTK